MKIKWVENILLSSAWSAILFLVNGSNIPIIFITGCIVFTSFDLGFALLKQIYKR